MLRRALFIINRIILNPNNILKINFGFYFVKSLDNPGNTTSGATDAKRTKLPHRAGLDLECADYNRQKMK